MLTPTPLPEKYPKPPLIETTGASSLGAKSLTFRIEESDEYSLHWWSSAFGETRRVAFAVDEWLCEYVEGITGGLHAGKTLWDFYNELHLLSIINPDTEFTVSQYLIQFHHIDTEDAVAEITLISKPQRE